MLNHTSPATTVLLVLLSFSMGSLISTQSAAANSVAVKCKNFTNKAAEMDKLATALADYTKVYRVEESIVMRFKEQNFYDLDSEHLTQNGQQFIDKVAADLSCYPDTRVYIQQNVGTSEPSKERAEDQFFLLETALREQGIEIIRIYADLTYPGEARKPIKIGQKKIPPKGYFELIIVPRV
jgi:hypothetical protein